MFFGETKISLNLSEENINTMLLSINILPFFVDTVSSMIMIIFVFLESLAGILT